MGLDIALGLIALGMAVSGYRHGFWQQIMRLLCLVVGLYAAEPPEASLKHFRIFQLDVLNHKWFEPDGDRFCRIQANHQTK